MNPKTLLLVPILSIALTACNEGEAGPGFDVVAGQNSAIVENGQLQSFVVKPDLSDGWHEYADYSWGDSSLGRFWLELTETQKELDGQTVIDTQGSRYVLDPTTDLAKLGYNDQKFELSTWHSILTERNSSLKVEQVTWSHQHLDDYLFNNASDNLTYSEDSLGQAVIYSVQYDKDLWLNWTYSEFGGQNISNLSDIIDQQLDGNNNNYSAVDISAYLIDGETTTETQDWPTMTESFIKDANGIDRTWYIVTNAFDGELRIQETTLPNIYSNWQLLIVPGGAQIYIPDGYQFVGLDEVFTYISLPPISSFDATTGRFSFDDGFGWDTSLPFHLFLDLAQAQEKLTGLKSQ